MAPEPVAVRSPQFHEYDAMVPSGSLDPDPLTEVVRVVSVWVNAAFGSWFGGAGDRDRRGLGVGLAAVVGHREGHRVGARRGVGVVWPWRRTPAAVASPQFHEYDAMVPSGSVERDPFTDIARFVSVWVNAAVGAWFSADR